MQILLIQYFYYCCGKQKNRNNIKKNLRKNSAYFIRHNKIKKTKAAQAALLNTYYLLLITYYLLLITSYLLLPTSYLLLLTYYFLLITSYLLLIQMSSYSASLTSSSWYLEVDCGGSCSCCSLGIGPSSSSKSTFSAFSSL